MNTRSIILFFTFLFIISCDNKTKEITYFPNGKISIEKFHINDSTVLIKEYFQNGNLKFIGKKINDKNEGEFKYFYKNGNIKQIDTWKNGIPFGKTTTFYDNGTPEYQGNIINGIKKGWFLYFAKERYLKEKQEYITLDTGYYLNQRIVFNREGDTLKNKSSYFSIKTKKDTIRLGDSLSMKIKLEASYFNDRMKVTVGNFDSVFNMRDSIVEKTEAIDFQSYYVFPNGKKPFGEFEQHVGKSFRLSAYTTVPDDTGLHYCRGYITDFNVFSTDSGDYSKRRILFFEKKYYVIEKKDDPS